MPDSQVPAPLIPDPDEESVFIRSPAVPPDSPLEPPRGEASTREMSAAPFPAALLRSPKFRRRWPFAVPMRPLQFPSLEHLDDAVARTLDTAKTTEGLQPATLIWMRAAYASFRKFLRDARVDRRFLGGQLDDQLALLPDWIGWMRGRPRPISQTGINTYWRGLDSLFRRLAQERGLLNPLEWLDPPRAGRHIPRSLTRKAAETMVTFIQHYQWRSRLEQRRNLLIVALMLLAGLRRQEVLRLNVGDVDLDQGTLCIRDSKGRFGRKTRTAYMPPQLRRLMEAYLAARRSADRSHAALLTSISGDRRIGISTLRRLFAIISEKTGIHVTPHALRHTTALLLREAGVADRISMDLLGHSSLRMLQHYSAVFDGEHLREAAKLQLDVDL